MWVSDAQIDTKEAATTTATEAQSAIADAEVDIILAPVDVSAIDGSPVATASD